MCLGVVTLQEIPASELRSRECYTLMTDLIAPRPIAWVSTVDAKGRPNLAPFSYFQAMCSRPPTVVLGIAWRSDGTMKDTLANILETREFVVHMVSAEDAEAMNQSSVDLPPGHSEWDFCQLSPTPAHSVAPSRIRGARAGMECRLQQAIPLGQGASGRPSSTIVIAGVQHFFVDAGLERRDDQGRRQAMDPAKLNVLGRMGGQDYCLSDHRLTLPRPIPPKLSESR